MGTRALAIAQLLDDLDLRALSTSYLEQAHFYRGEYERVVELGTANLAALPVDWVDEHFETGRIPTRVVDRMYLVMSLAHLGRFPEAAEHEGEMIQLGETTQRVFPVVHAYSAVGTLHLIKGDWAKARSPMEHAIAALRAGNVVAQRTLVIASSAWALAQLGEATEALHRLREGDQLLESETTKGSTSSGWACYALGRSHLLLGRLDDARDLGDRLVEPSSSQVGITAHALHLLGDIAIHPDRFDAERGETHYRRALALAEPRGMRPLVAHCHLGLGKLNRRIGNRDQAREHLTNATAMYREMDMRFWLEQAEANRET